MYAFIILSFQNINLQAETLLTVLKASRAALTSVDINKSPKSRYAWKYSNHIPQLVIKQQHEWCFAIPFKFSFATILKRSVFQRFNTKSKVCRKTASVWKYIKITAKQSHSSAKRETKPYRSIQWKRWSRWDLMDYTAFAMHKRENFVNLLVNTTWKCNTWNSNHQGQTYTPQMRGQIVIAKAPECQSYTPYTCSHICMNDFTWVKQLCVSYRIT